MTNYHRAKCYLSSSPGTYSYFSIPVLCFLHNYHFTHLLWNCVDIFCDICQIQIIQSCKLSKTLLFYQTSFGCISCNFSSRSQAPEATFRGWSDKSKFSRLLWFEFGCCLWWRRGFLCVTRNGTGPIWFHHFIRCILVWRRQFPGKIGQLKLSWR